MTLSGLCMYCMKANIVNGRCPVCGKSEDDGEKRNARALPVRDVVHNRYYVGRVLGAGGFGITYMAWDMNENRRIALKELFPCDVVTRSSDGRSIEVDDGKQDYFNHIMKRFLDEAKLLSQFGDSKEIIDVYHLFPENNTAYYAMEYIEGQDLKHILKQSGKMTWTKFYPIAMQILTQLIAIHSKGLIHRDISPDNIYITDKGVAKLIDFGSVRTYAGRDGYTTFLKHNFAPPEQYRENSDQGPWTDIYSMSVTMYYTLSGKLPPKSPERQINDSVIPLGKLVPDLPGYVVSAIHKGMAVECRDRFQNVQSFMEALNMPARNNTKPPPIQERSQRTNTDQIIQHRQSAPPMIVCIEGSKNGQTYQILPNNPVTVGRQPPCTVLYPNDAGGISRKHCTITMDSQGRMYIRDDNSTYGTMVNGIRIAAGVWVYVKRGSLIRFGREKYRAVY